MTRPRSEDLIADARDWARDMRAQFPLDGTVWDDARLVDRLADALEASRAPQPTEDVDYDSELAVMLSQMLDDEPMWSCVVIAKRLHAAGFRRAPAEPAVTDEMVERALAGWYRLWTEGFSDYHYDQMRAALRAAFATRGTDDEQ